MENEQHSYTSNPAAPVSPQTIATLNEITIILIVVSLLIVAGTAFFQLDFVPAVLLGCLLVGLNFYITRRILLRLLLFKDLKRRMLVFYLLKLGLSGMVLYLAIVHLQISGLGILIGLSNIVITVFILLIKRTLFPSIQLPKV